MTEITLGFGKCAYWSPESREYEINQEIRDWLLPYAYSIEWSIDEQTRGILVTFEFMDPDVAILFKLTWG